MPMGRNAPRFLLSLSCLWVVFGGARVSHAQPGLDDGAYSRVVGEAVEEFNRGNWAEARALFERAHALQPNARTERGLGITAFEMRHYVDAVRDLQASLDDARNPLSHEQRMEVSEILVRAQRYVGSLRLNVQPPGALILLDGRPCVEFELAMDVGDHRLDASAPDYQPVSLNFTVQTGRVAMLNVELVRNTANASPPLLAAPPPASTTGDAAQADPHRHRHDGFYLRFGIGAGGGSFAGSVSSRDVRTDGAGIDGRGLTIPVELAVGATVLPGLVVGVGSLGSVFPAPHDRMKNYGVTAEGDAGSMILSTLGPIVDYYIFTTGGWHVQAGFAYALAIAAKGADNAADTPIPSDNYSGNGWSAMLGAGWDAWIGAQWSLGVLARVQYGHAHLSTTSASDAVSTNFLLPTLLATITYH